MDPHINDKLADIEYLCAYRKKRLTPIRRTVLQILLQEGRCMKAYELLDKLKEYQPNAKPATVYRSLEFLEEEGIIHRLDAVNGWTVCHDIHSKHHDLLVVCTECNQVQEISAPSISQQLHNLMENTGFTQSTPQVEIRALCENCQNKK